jgi:predicted Mrr-cat superfamily restriction endonuclease
MSMNAFILRIAPGGEDKVPEALASNQIIIGWALAEDLLDQSLDWEKFREIMHSIYYKDEPTRHKAGAASGHMWRFIRDMKVDDLVVVPYKSCFYVAKITGPCIYLKEKIDDDSAFRRPVQWMNDKKPLERNIARSALISRMKVQGTTADATDLLDEIHDCLKVASSSEKPTFQSDLHARLVKEALSEIQKGRIESFGFEDLIRQVLLGLGANECRIIPRQSDKGADLVATFRVAGAFQQRIAVQAKHWQPDPPVDRVVVEQLIHGIEAEAADLGMVVTSGNISEDAVEAAQKYFEEKGIRIELVDGSQFAKLIVEHGLLARIS